MGRIWKLLRGERAHRKREQGQTLIIFALLIAPISFAVGVVAVDGSAWVSERRGAQKDADLAALAGATELLLGGTDAAAEAAATQFAVDNDEAGNGAGDIANLRSVVADDSCWGDTGITDSVTVDLDHDAGGFFLQAFNVPLPQPGAHARACLGSIISSQGHIPIEVHDHGPCFESEGVPDYVNVCPLEFGSQDQNPRGVIDLVSEGNDCSDANGSGDLYDLILNGASGFCTIDQDDDCDPDRNGPWDECVAVQTGNAKKIINGFADRIAREGSCDFDGDGVEEYEEVTTAVTGTLREAVTCPNGKISPRLVTIFVLEEDPMPGGGGNNQGRPIEAFASMYLEGCTFDNDTDNNTVDNECTVKNKNGHIVIWGRFVRLITEGDVGPIDPTNTTDMGVALVE